MSNAMTVAEAVDVVKKHLQLEYVRLALATDKSLGSTLLCKFIVYFSSICLTVYNKLRIIVCLQIQASKV